MDQRKIRALLSSVDAVLQSMRLSASGDPSNIWRFSSYQVFIRKYNQLVEQARPFLPEETVLDLYDEQKVLGLGDTIPLTQKHLFDSVFTNLAILRGYLATNLDVVEDEVANLKNFLRANLRRAVFQAPDRETQIQDAVEAILIGRGLAKGRDYDRETGRVKVSLKEAVPDFIFPRLDLALEVKLSKAVSKPKALVDEINADIRAYGNRYGRQLFLVYDLGTIRDEAEFTNDLDNAANVSVIVVKH